MPQFDWTSRDALTSIRRSYLARGQRVELEAHSLAVSFGAMAAGVSVDRTLQIPQEADFIWIGTSVRPHGNWSISGGPNHELAGFNVRITVTPPGRVLGTLHDTAGGPDGFVPILNVAGSGRCPFVWPIPLVIGGSGLVRFELRNRGATSFTPHLALLGARARRFAGAA